MLSRRGLLAATAGTVAFSTPAVGPAANGGTALAAGGSGSGVDDGPTLRVRVYPGPTPMYARLRDGASGLGSGWTTVHRDSLEAVRDALEQVREYAAGAGVDGVTGRVEPRSPLGSRFGVASPRDAFRSPSTIGDRFREAVRDRGLVDGRCCHLLLWWGPVNFDLGYGRTAPGTTTVADESDADAYTIANVGATEMWDSRAVTRNMAIHETLHTFVSPEEARAINGSSCDHDLGTAVETEPGVREVSPMATAYAGPNEVGGDGTRWFGSGCYDHDAFARHDGRTGVDEWRYTTELSEATLEAVTLYVRRHLR